MSPAIVQSSTALFAFVLVALFTGVSATAQNQIVVLEGGSLIDGTGRDPISDAVVVIDGSRIEAIGPRGQVSYPDGALVIDPEGKTILPGLIDPHVHLREWMPQMFLRYGVTTVADTNNHHAWIVVQREGLNRGRIKGPRLYVAGQGMGGPDGTPGPTNRTLRNAEEAGAFVREMTLLGVDILKTQADLTPDQVSVIVEQAAAAGLPIVGHSRNVREATLLGLKFMEHTDPLVTAILEEMGPEALAAAARGDTNAEDLMDTRLFDPLIDLMVEEGVFVNNTMVVRMRGASRRVIAGSDAGYIPGLSLHYEMQMIADSGVSPMNAILDASR